MSLKQYSAWAFCIQNPERDGLATEDYLVKRRQWKQSQVPWAFSSRLTLPCLTIEHILLDWLFTSFQISVILPSSVLTKSYRFCFSGYPAFTHMLFFSLYSYYSLFVYMFPLQNSVLDFLSMRLQSCYVPNLQKKNTKIILRVGIANHIIFFLWEGTSFHLEWCMKGHCTPLTAQSTCHKDISASTLRSFGFSLGHKMFRKILISS